MGRAIGLILFGFLAVILMTVGLTACSSETGVLLGQVTLGESFQDTAVADYIVIGGKITDPMSGAWLNDYTVIPYLNGQEISNPANRAISRMGKYSKSGEGVHDGYFALYIPNQYELTAAHDFINANGSVVKMQYVDGGITRASHLYIWLREINPGETFRLNVPEKRIEYAIAVMSDDNAHLSPEIHQNSTTLHEDGRVTKQTDDTSPERVAIPETSKQISWTRLYTAPNSVAIWETWTLYVENQVPGMDWNTYYVEVLKQNPDLAQTGYFVKDQDYYLPILSES